MLRSELRKFSRRVSLPTRSRHRIGKNLEPMCGWRQYRLTTDYAESRTAKIDHRYWLKNRSSLASVWEVNCGLSYKSTCDAPGTTYNSFGNEARLNAFSLK